MWKVILMKKVPNVNYLKIFGMFDISFGTSDNFKILINCEKNIYSTDLGKYHKPPTGIGIPAHSCVCLEVNTHTKTLYYFINNKHIKGRVVNVPKDVYFGV
jgi:hypothetical protein